jgi:hypothetical protein
VSCCLVPPCRIAGTGTTLKGSYRVVPCHRARRHPPRHNGKEGDQRESRQREPAWRRRGGGEGV